MGYRGVDIDEWEPSPTESNIGALISLIGATDYKAAHRDKGWLPARIILGCTFPLTPDDSDKITYKIPSVKREYEWKVIEHYRRGIDLENIIS